MAKLSVTISKRHPIALLLHQLLNGYCDPYTIEAALRVSADLLDSTIGRYHDISFSLNRIRTFALDYFGLHADAESVLRNNLADLDAFFGPASAHNLSRLFSLAGCLYRKGDLKGASREMGNLLALLPKRRLEPHTADPHPEQISTQSVAGWYHDRDLGGHRYRESTAQAGEECLGLWLRENAANGSTEHVLLARELAEWLGRGAPGGFWTHQTPDALERLPNSRFAYWLH
ncbi:hypothetical protein PMZ80_002201 [Knufia obscura]|uniref:Tetratricopeptide repeat protein n=2 Tax=Knufia TaxID=430999 RepID=A0AAN8E7J1_9EURO|nr:hypothetical protein PMZ80_002201 [Knufia obscura]KAK5947894.1 hypothetical protein OHC33_011101 [Knufia fluminis]